MEIASAHAWFAFCVPCSNWWTFSFLRSSPSRHMSSCSKKFSPHNCPTPAVDAQDVPVGAESSHFSIRDFGARGHSDHAFSASPGHELEIRFRFTFLRALLAEVWVGHGRPGVLILQLPDAVDLRACIPGFPRSANQHLGPCPHRGPGRLRPRRQAITNALLEYTAHMGSSLN